MRRTKGFWPGIIIILGLILILASPASFSGASDSRVPASRLAPDLEALLDAWDRGDYLVALAGLEKIVAATDDQEILEPISLLTGSLFPISELLPDGRNPRFSPDGRYLLVDFGPNESPSFAVFSTGEKYQKIAELKGARAVFSPTEPIIAYLSWPEVGKIKEIQEELTRLTSAGSPDRAKIMALQSQLILFGSKESKVILHDLRTEKERILNTGSLLKNDLAFSSDGREIWLVAGAEEEAGANQIYTLKVDEDDGNQEPKPITSGPGFKVSPRSIPGGRYFLYLNSPVDPFSRPVSEGASAGQQPAGQPSPTSPPGFLRRQPREFSVVDRERGETRKFEGTGVEVSPAGEAVVFISRVANENLLKLVRLDGTWSEVTLKKTAESISSPSFSPDGSQVAFEMPVYGNSEIFLTESSGQNETRLTTEIQPDRLPRFLANDRVMAIKGEPRHSRAYLYDLKSGKVIRVFHNETIRTIAPEYEWAIHPEGKAVVIVADRDGDTMSPERGVYLVDLTSHITREELLKRIKSQYEAEAQLRRKAAEWINPLAAKIQNLIGSVSPRRLFAYQKALFAFDSKHVAQPGNLKAVEYIQKTLASFGYQPELQWVPNRPNKTANVVAVLKGAENPDLYYVLSSHFDSNARGPGADDNSSATAVLLETARVLAAHPLPSSLIFAAFTGEEAGFWGSREFARLARENKLQVLGAINNDMIGWTEDHRLDNTIRYANAGLRDLMHAASIGFSRMVTYDAHYIRSTDAVPLYEAFGNVVAGLGSYPVLGNPFYHTALDRLETVNQQLISEATKFMVAAVVMMVSSPSPVRDLKASVRPDRKIEITWSPNPEKGIEFYEVSWQADEASPEKKLKVKTNRAVITLEGRAKEPKILIKVRAVNRLGLPSWDATPLKLGT